MVPQGVPLSAVELNRNITKKNMAAEISRPIMPMKDEPFSQDRYSQYSAAAAEAITTIQPRMLRVVMRPRK